MTTITSKRPSRLDANQTLQHGFNDADDSFTMGSFLTSKLGHKIVIENVAAPDLEGQAAGTYYKYYDKKDVSYNLLYTLKLLFSDSGKMNMVSAERVE